MIATLTFLPVKPFAATPVQGSGHFFSVHRMRDHAHRRSDAGDGGLLRQFGGRSRRQRRLHEVFPGALDTAAGGLDERLDGPGLSLPSLDHDLDAAARDRAELRAGAMR